MPQLDMATWPSQLFWLGIAFFALYFVVSRIAIPRTGQVIEQRKSTIDGDLAAATRLRGETDQAVKTYEASLAEARSKANAIALENRNAIGARVDSERAGVDAKLMEKITRAEGEIATARGKALDGVAAIADDLAATIVAEFSGSKARV
jgi:F-type H+-transporting ATPase subunit b